jgi:hypothetical protein
MFQMGSFFKENNVLGGGNKLQGARSNPNMNVYFQSTL